MDYIWMFVLVITHLCAYHMGRNDAAEQLPDESAWMELNRYEIDQKYAHMRWLEERKAGHDKG